MDALVYEDSPLATYFEAEATPFNFPREPTTPPPAPFAPTGLPQFKDRLKKIRRTGTSPLTPTSTEQLLEKFRYVIVASQLLLDEAGPRAAVSDHDFSTLDRTSIAGAAVTAAISFFAAWAMHWLRSRKRKFKTTTWFDVGIYSVGIVLMGTATSIFAQQQYTKQVQRGSVQMLTRLVDDSYAFDHTALSAVRFIQEVEVVARGYDLGPQLPPISRLEDASTTRRCRNLRSQLAQDVKILTVLLVEGHNAIQPFVSSTDLQRYHDIYEISWAEYSQAIELVNNEPENNRDSLRELRFSLRLHVIARRVFLCDLLALRSTPRLSWTRMRQWRSVSRILTEIEDELSSRHHALSQRLSLEEYGDGKKSSSSRQSMRSRSSSNSVDSRLSVVELQSRDIKSKTRKFEELSQSIRAMNARMHMLKEEISGLTSSKTEEMVVASALSKHYEAIGSDIRNLVSEWERGCRVMQNTTDHEVSTRCSRSSSSIRSPISPSPSVGGGVQIVDGGPAEALRLLNGDADPHDSPSLFGHRRRKTFADLDEQVFEGMSSRSTTRPRLSVSGMTREEKIAKLQEDRRKRATLQEQADTTTNMLKELKMVMKHRPRAATTRGMPTPVEEEGSKRVTSF